MNRIAFVAVLAGCLVYPETAFADPVSLLAGTTLLSSLSVATGISAGALASGIIYGTVAAGSFLLGGRRKKTNPQEIKNTTKGTEGPGRFAFGRTEAGAKIGFGNTRGYSIYRLLFHYFGKLDGIEEYIYEGREIVVASNGDVESPPWVKSDGSYLNIKTAIGDGDEQAWPDLLTDFPSIWTPEHRARGIAQTLMKITNPGIGSKKFSQLLNSGVRELKILARNGSFYDPRDDSTKWSINGVLHCLHFFRELPGIDDAEIDFDSTKAVVTQGAALVPTLTGTAPRCQMSGGWEGPLTTDIVEDMLESAGLEIIPTSDGVYTLSFLEDNPAPQITFALRHIVSIDFKSGPDSGRRPNTCKLEYFSPERRYEVAEVDLSNAAWAKVPDEIAKYGDQEFRVQLPFCCDASQAQRIARRLFHMARADFGTVITNFSGVAAWGLRTAMIEFPDVGVNGASVFKECVIDSVRVDDAAGTCEIPFAIIPDILKTPWNPATDEQPAPPVLKVGQYESELDIPIAPIKAVTVQYPDNSYEVRVVLTPVDDADVVEANYRAYTNGQPDSWISMAEDKLTLAYVVRDLSGQPADFRVRYVNSDGESSHFSELLSVADVAIDNTPVTKPAMDVDFDLGGNATITITLVDDIQVVSLVNHYQLFRFYGGIL